MDRNDTGKCADVVAVAGFFCVGTVTGSSAGASRKLVSPPGGTENQFLSIQCGDAPECPSGCISDIRGDLTLPTFHCA